MSLPPHGYWQEIHRPGYFPSDPGQGYADLFPAELPDGRQIAFPIRVLPGDGRHAVASLILNQASFAVEDAIADVLAITASEVRPDILVGVPTLGLSLANAVARRLGHARMVALGTSRKFWYDEALSAPVASITTPDQQKRLYLDPRMIPVLTGKRVAVVDDVLSTGQTFRSVLEVLSRAGVVPVAGLFAMLQGTGWHAFGPELQVTGAVRTPILELGKEGRWRPQSAAWSD